MDGRPDGDTRWTRVGLAGLRTLAMLRGAVQRMGSSIVAVPRTVAEIRARLQATRWYWRVRTRAQRMQLTMRRKSLQTQRSLDSGKGLASSGLRVLGRLVVAAALVALCLAVAMLLDKVMAPAPSSLDPEALQALASGRDSFASVALVTLQLGATVLGLYLAALSVIVSTVYRRSTSSVRRAAEQEVLGNLGVRSTGFLSLLSLGCLAAMRISSFTPGVAAWALLLGSAAFAVVSLVPATKSAFDLFSPTSLLHRMLREVVDAFETALHEEGSSRPSQAIQQSCRRTARQNLQNIRVLVEIVDATPSPTSASWSTFGTYLSDALAVYWSKKGGFPPESQWFERALTHESWFTASHAEASVALHVGHYLTPKETPDHLWFEREVGTQLDSLVGDAIAAHAWPHVTSLVRLQGSLTGLAASRGAVDAALLFADFASASAKQVEARLGCSPSEALDTKNTEILAAYAQAAHWPISLSVGFVQWAEGFSTSFIDRTATAVLALRSPTDWPDMEAAAHVWDLRDKLAVERRIEGRVLTARWYAAEMCAYAATRLAIKAAEGLTDVAERTLEEVKARSSEQDLAFLVAAESLGRAGVRVMSSFDRLVSITQSLQAYRVTFDPWPELDEEALRGRLEGVRTGFVDVAPAYGATADELPRSSRLPDYLGFGQTLLCEACFDALFERDGATFNTTFVALLGLTIRAQERLRAEGLKYQGGVPVLVEPMLDLMTVSGAAYLVDRSTDLDVWQAVVGGWTTLAEAMGGPDKLQSYLSAVCDSMSPGMGFSQRSLQRGAWKQRFSAWMSHEGLLKPDQYHPFMESERERVSDDELANHVLTTGLDPFGLDNTFLAALVLGVPGMTRDGLPRWTENLLAWVDRHEKEGPDEAQS